MNDEDVRPVYIAAVIDQMRASGDVPAEALAEVERQHTVFQRDLGLASDPDVLEQAFGFGLIVGAYIGGTDAVPEADRLLRKWHGGKGGNASAASRHEKAEKWHEPAKVFALAMLAENSSIRKKTLYAEVCNRLKQAGVAFGAESTVRTFVRNIEKDKKLLMRQKSGQSKRLD